jgi:hypothetical protein
MQQQRLGQEHLKGAQMDNQQHQMQMDQTQALNSAYQNALTVGSDGTPTIDKGKLTQHLGTSGHGAAIPGVLKSMAEFEKSTAELSELRGKVASAEQDYAGTVGAAAKSANYDPHLFLMSAQHAIDAKAVNPQMITPMLQQVQQALQADPSGEQARQMVQQIADHFIAQSPAQQKLLNEKKTADARALTAATGERKTNAELPGLVAKSLQEQLVTAAQSLGAVNDQPAWDQWRAGLSPELQAKVPANFSQPAKSMVEGLGMTAEQRTTAAGQAAVRTESQRHDRVTEGLGAGRLNVERQRLGMEFGPMGGAPGMTAAASGVTGEEFLKSLPPAVGQQIKALAEGRMAIPFRHGALRSRTGKTCCARSRSTIRLSTP